MKNLKRPLEIKIRLNYKEFNLLSKNVKKSGMSRESYIRSLINGYIPREKPTRDYSTVIKELRCIGNNLNQMAKVANTKRDFDEKMYINEVAKLQKQILGIQLIVNSPISYESKKSDKIF